MGERRTSPRIRRLALTGLLVGALIAGLAHPANADKPREPSAHLSGAQLYDNGWVMVSGGIWCDAHRGDAWVSVTQPQASGEEWFPVLCSSYTGTFREIVDASEGAFEPGEAQVSLFVVLQGGRTKELRDSMTVRL